MCLPFLNTTAVEVMPVLKIDVSPSDIEENHWQPALQDAVRATVDAYGTAFKNLSDSREAENGNQVSVPSLLAAICHIALAVGRKDGPFVPMFSGSSRRSPLPKDLSDTELDALDRVLSQADDPELSSRLADILWLQTENHRKAQEAIQSYINSARKLEGDGEHASVPMRLERAFDLSALFGGQRGDRAEETLDEIASLLLDRSEEGITSGTLDMLDVLIERRPDDSAKWADIAEGFAKQLSEQRDYHPASNFWRRAIQALRKTDDEDQLREAQVREAEIYVTLADEAPSEKAAASFIRKAFEAYRKIPDSDERQEELHRRLLDHQEHVTEEMGQISTEVDLQDLPEQARKSVRDQSFLQALYSLATLKTPLDPERLRQRVQSEEFQLQLMLPKERVNALGRVIGTKPSGTEDPEGALKSMIHDEANRDHQIAVSALINPGRLQILQDHPTVRVKDFRPLTRHNAFIPEGREQQFARGLNAGLQGDFLIAGHLLIPQVENSLRIFLQRQGVITTGLDSSSKRQNEQSLNVTLHEYQDELESIFGQATVFDLQNLLVEPFGSNLRNEAMHGLMDDGAFYTQPVVYLWWLILRICCHANQGPLPDGFERNAAERKQPDEDSSQKDDT
jgi:tetratricopeptide (TPR) repeat protein